MGDTPLPEAPLTARVQLGPLPRLVADLVRTALADQPDIIVVGTGSRSEPVEPLGEHPPDVLIVEETRLGGPGSIGRILWDRPTLTVLAIRVGEADPSVSIVRMDRETRELSAETLRSAIREAVSFTPSHRP